MEKRMEISVVIPVFNKERYIKRTLMSVLSQNMKPAEILVVDDGSTDNSAEIVKSINDSRIHLIQQENAGECGARNTGINAAENEIVALLDADDEWKPDFLTHIKRLYINFPDCGIYATAFERILPDGKIKILDNFGIPPEPWIGIIASFFALAQKEMPFFPSSVAVNKDYCIQEGGFPVGVKRGGDKMMWIRMALKYPIAYSPSSQVIYHTEAINRACNIHFYDGEKPYCTMIDEMFNEDGIPASLKDDVKDYYAFEQIGKAKELIKAGRSKKARELLQKLNDNENYQFERNKYYLISLFPEKLINRFLSIKNLIN